MGKIEDYRKMELEETETGELVLLRNGKPCLCPMASRLALPGHMANTIQIQSNSCSSNCPLFDVTAFGVSLRCGNKASYSVLFKPFVKATFIKT